jgi:hypothetical protein
MTASLLALLRWDAQRRWIEPVLVGAGLGFALVALQRLGLGPAVPELGPRAAAALNGAIGPVWIPMSLACVRVAWLAARALRTRNGGGRLGEPVRPELGQIAPIFAVLPAWSWLEVRAENGEESFALDRRRLGSGEAGLRAGVEGLRARGPEAVCLAFDRRIPKSRRDGIRMLLWQQIDGGIRLREIAR